MLSSDDSFGWSAASDDSQIITMSSSEDDQASQVSSVQERREHKKQLKESLLQHELTSNVVPSGVDNREPLTEDTPRKSKKKKKVKSESNLDENVNTPEGEMINKIITLETEDSPIEKIKKKKIKAEPEEQHVIEETSTRKKNKIIKCNSELQETENVQYDVVKLEDTGHTPKKKKKKRKHSMEQEEADIETPDESVAIPPTPEKFRKNNESQSSYHQHFSGTLKDSAQPSTAKKEKKKKISLADATDIDLTREKAREFIRKDSVHFDDSEMKDEAIKHNESYTSSATLKISSHKNSTYSESLTEVSPRKNKKNKKVIEDKSESQLDKNVNSPEREMTNKIIKLEAEDSPKDKIEKKKVTSEPKEQHVIEEAGPRKKNKKSKRNSELQETDNVQDNLVKLEDTGHTPKEKKKKQKHSVEQEEADIEAQDESFAILPTSKKFKKNNESQSSDHHNFNGTLKNSDQPSSAKKEKNKNILLADDTNIEVTREKAREFIHKNSVHFDDSKINEEATNIKRKESDTSPATLKSPSHKNSTSSASSQRKVSITSIVSADSRDCSSQGKVSITSVGNADRRDSSSSAATSTRKVSISSIASSKRRRSSSSSSNRSRSRSSSFSSTHSKPTRSKIPEKVESRRKSSSPHSRSNTKPNRNRKTASPAYRVEETRKRTSLSKKIRFEDDTDGPDSETDFKSSKNDSNLCAQFEKFMDKNPKLKPVRSFGSDKAIGSDDDVWVLKCPKGFDHEKLKDMDISIDSKTKIKLDGQTFDGVLEEETHRIAIVFPSQQKNAYVIKDIQPKGTLIFRKRIPEVHINEMSIAVPRETFIPLPETKRRHPLFGHDYRKFIKTHAAVVERLNETEPRKKLKSKRKHKIEEISKDEPDFLTQEDVEIKKKNKKRKRKLSDTGSGESIVKKFKHDPHSTIVWDSEKAIEKSLFNF